MVDVTDCTKEVMCSSKMVNHVDYLFIVLVLSSIAFGAQTRRIPFLVGGKGVNVMHAKNRPGKAR